ncbi:E3 ubiquitin-protein ligase TRIM39-like [Eucyclogobius newberryi]|uniref:E3 ubiquitin-protein ligase TRIM39-like n=1 Tax=Eucyclogobius newberryi TaxID=166745 RepID=UPI003B5A80A2
MSSTSVCSEPKLKALKSCLVCRSSFCETHLQPHLTVSGLKRHQLMEPVENLEDQMCPKHQRPLELFCGTDQSCVCSLCVLEHKNHELLSLEEACESRRSSLLHTQAQSQHMVEQRRLKVQEIQRCVELSDTEVHRERAVGLQAFTDLMQSVQRRQDRFLEELQEKQSRSHKRAQELVQQLEQEICELEKSSTEAERLSRSQDPLHFLQSCPALTPPAGLKEWSSVSFEPETCEGSAARALSELEKHLSENFNKVFKQLASESNRAELKRVLQFVADVTLDPDTAHPDLVLSEDLKQVHDTDMEKELPDSPLRFYFEIQVKGKTAWTLGVAQESINRKRVIHPSPKNGFWCIRLRNKDQYLACTNSSVGLSLQRAPQKVGVFVDYDEGLVSFYDADSADLLFSFSSCCFREKLFPYFCPSPDYRGSNSAPLVLTALEPFTGQSD